MRFVNEGAYVFITGRREPELATAAKEMGSMPAVHCHACRDANRDRAGGVATGHPTTGRALSLAESAPDLDLHL
jgi:short-subunit dehydrogenase involved in D-alanine esterification of teichoic acids